MAQTAKTRVRFKPHYAPEYPDQVYTVLSHYRWLGYTKVYLFGETDGYYYRPYNFEVEEIKDGNEGAPEGAEIREPVQDSGADFGSAFTFPQFHGAESGRFRSDRPNECNPPKEA